MTRETKIGLLVGLAFIIVVGILLSEHLTTTTERPSAPLAEAGVGVREAVAVPGINSSDPATTPYRAPEPVHPVPTARELSQPASTIPPQVAVGPGSDPKTPILITNTPTAPAIIPGVEKNESTNPQPVTEPPVVTRVPTDIFANQHPIQTVAQQHGESVIPASPSVQSPTPVTSTGAPTSPSKVREYTAQPGDTLSRIAALLPGGNTKTNRDAILALNPELQKDPNKVIAGRKYQLPTEVGSKKTVLTPEPMVQTPSPVVRSTPADSRRSTPQTYRTYVVKKGDSLSKIAMEQLGSKSHVSLIRELNQDVLKGSDVIRIDMKLKLPARTVASTD